MAPSVTKFPVANEAVAAATWQSVINEMGGNFVSSGLAPSDGGGLTLNISDGVVFCGGIKHELTGGPFANTMTNATTNYVFFDPATQDFHIDTDNSRPTNAVRIATVTTAGSDITNPTSLDTREGQVGLPVGIITIWSGSTASIPFGWQLCNGTNGTPDLRDKFVVGAGSTYSVGDTGGEATHVLTTAEMPAHTHTYYLHQAAATNYAIFQNNYAESSATTGSTGGDTAHENRPPYYALAYIMRM